MKWYLLSLGVILCGFTSSTPEIQRGLRNTAFSQGESLEYRLHYGFMNAGKGVLEVGPNLFTVNGKPCYRISVHGKSVGAFAMMLKVEDKWGTFVDTASLIPEQAYRDIQEGKYLLKETVFYNHEGKKLRQESTKRDKKKESKEYDVPSDIHDIVSGYYYFRNIDWNSKEINEVVTIKAFFEDKLYDFKVRYKGKETIDTDLGDIRAIRLVPIVPKNDLFEGENSLRFWLSDDGNRIPLRVEADMFVGKVALDVQKVKGLRHRLNKVK